MNLNVFEWIREGVRQSVMAGVSDALENIGTPPDGDDLKARVQSTFANRLENPAGRSTTVDAPRGKRLGRSLKDLNIENGK